MRGRKSKVDEEGGQQGEEKVAETVTDWVTVKRRTSSKSRKTYRVCVEVDRSKVITMEVELTDKVSDFVKRISKNASERQQA